VSGVVPVASSFLSDLVDVGISPGEKIVRSLLVFAFLVVALRLGGKRELAQINVLDLAVLLLVSNALQNAMIGNDNSLLGGVIGASGCSPRTTCSCTSPTGTPERAGCSRERRESCWRTAASTDGRCAARQ